MPGFSSGTLHGKLGIRAGNTGYFSLQDVRVPQANMLGNEGEGFKIAMFSLENGRYTVASGATGVIRASRDASVAYANTREVQGQTIGNFQLVKQKIANMEADYQMSHLLWLKSRLSEKRGQTVGASGEPGEMAGDGAFGNGRVDGDRDPRRQRLHERLPGRALSAKLQSGGDL